MSLKTNPGSNGLDDAALPLEQLSWIITKNASIVSQHLAANHLPQPSFNEDGPSVVVPNDTPESVQQARHNLMAAALEIFQLATGPSEFLPNLATGFQHISCLAWLFQHRIFHLVPLETPISYAALSTASGVSASRLKSILRMAMTSSLFREIPDDGGSVAHSATSALLAQNADVYAYGTYMCTKSAPVAMQMAAAASRWGPNSTQPRETAFNLAFGTDLPFFEHLTSDPEWTASFAGYMRSVRSSDGVALRHLIAGFDWDRLCQDGEKAAVVDVGGSTGGAALALAEAFPQLTVVVQDLPANVESGRKKAEEAWAPDIFTRVTFQAHDFMKPQPVRAADAYLLRMILHDWPDEEAVVILKNLVEAMDGRSRLLIMDTVLPAPGSVPVSVERVVRVRDLTMLQAFNSKERDLDDWKQLLALADPRLALVNVVQPFGSAMAVLEVMLS